MIDIFKEIKTKKNWIVDDGRENEDKLEIFLRKTNLTKYNKENFFKKDFKILKQYFFNKLNKEEGMFSISEIIEENPEFDYTHTNIFIREPFGSQSFPDFLIILEDSIIPIEVKKSNKTNKPMMNNSYFHNSSIYLYSNENNVTFFLGEDIVSNEFYKLAKEFKEDFEKLHQKSKEKFSKLSLEENPFGINIYPRLNYSYNKFYEETKTNFFIKEDMEKRENNVLKYLESLK